MINLPADEYDFIVTSTYIDIPKGQGIIIPQGEGWFLVSSNVVSSEHERRLIALWSRKKMDKTGPYR